MIVNHSIVGNIISITSCIFMRSNNDLIFSVSWSFFNYFIYSWRYSISGRTLYFVSSCRQWSPRESTTLLRFWFYSWFSLKRSCVSSLHGIRILLLFFLFSWCGFKINFNMITLITCILMVISYRSYSFSHLKLMMFAMMFLMKSHQ